MGEYPKLFKDSNINRLSTLVYQDPVVNSVVLTKTGYDSGFDKILKRLNLTIHLQDNEWIIHKNTETIAKTKTLKSKIQLLILKYPEKINEFNPLYEECKDKKLIIELNDNFKIW